MQFETLLKIPYLIVMPRKYFEEAIKDKSFNMSDLISWSLGIIIAFTAIDTFTFDVINKYDYWLNTSAYIIGTIIGLGLSFAFRTYFLTFLLKRSGEIIDFKKTGIIVCVASVVSFFLLLAPILLQTTENIKYFEIGIKAWNIILIFVGILTISQIKFIKGLFIVLFTIGIELLFKYAIHGIGI